MRNWLSGQLVLTAVSAHFELCLLLRRSNDFTMDALTKGLS